MSWPLRWSLVTEANAAQFDAARVNFECINDRDTAPDYVLAVEDFLGLEVVGPGDELLIGQLGEDIAAMAWWTATESFDSKLLAYGVHPDCRDHGQTAQTMLNNVIQHRRLVAEQSMGGHGFRVWCQVHPGNWSSKQALTQAGFREIVVTPASEDWGYYHQF